MAAAVHGSLSPGVRLLCLTDQLPSRWAGRTSFHLSHSSTVSAGSKQQKWALGYYKGNQALIFRILEDTTEGRKSLLGKEIPASLWAAQQQMKFMVCPFSPAINMFHVPVSVSKFQISKGENLIAWV